MSVNIVDNDVNSESKVQKIVNVVPWYNADQFKKVYQFLYSDELVKKKWAYDTLSVWDTRCHPSLPSAVEASYILTSAIIQDIMWTNQASIIHYTDMQGIYGSAVTRFVSLTVEVHQDYPHNRSAAEIAKGLGIPSFIVDARNEWCHSSRPSLSMLRLAAQAALKYLKESYWEIEAARVKNYVKKPLDETELKRLLHHYIYVQLHILFRKGEKSSQAISEEIKKLKEEYLSDLIKLENRIKKNKRLFIKALVSDGTFIPLDEDLKCMVSVLEFSQFQAECDEDNFDDDDDDEDEESVSSYDYEKTYIPDIPDIHEALWAPVIYALNKHNAVPMFMESLLRSQGDRTIAGQKLIIAWILKILRIHAAGGCLEQSRLRKIFRKKGIVANWRSMFYSAVVNPCKYATIIFPLIFCHLDLKKDVTLRILNLMAIYLGQVNDEHIQLPKNHKIFSVDELKRMKELQKAERAKMSGKLADSIWSLCSDDRHKSWPIGYIINAVEDEESDDQQIEEDFLENFIEKTDFTERLLPSNENDNEEHCVMDVDSPDMILTDFEEIKKEMNKRKSFLYRK